VLFALSVPIAVALALGACTSSYSGDEAVSTPPPEEPVTRAEPSETEDDPRDVFSDIDFYGSWFWIDPYGWTWRPTVVMEWRPFVNGQWIWTNWGWTWVSYEPFGWATCHYGWWGYDFALGWLWIPGYDWSPAPVRWIGWDEMVGWAPAPWGDQRWPEPWVAGRFDPWVIVSDRHFVDPQAGRVRRKPRFKPGRVTMRRKAPDPTVLERDGIRSFRVSGIHTEKATVGRVTLRRLALPPRARKAVAKRARARERAFRVEYRRRNGVDPAKPARAPRWKKSIRDEHAPGVTPRKSGKKRGKKQKANGNNPTRGVKKKPHKEKSPKRGRPGTEGQPHDHRMQKHARWDGPELRPTNTPSIP